MVERVSTTKNTTAGKRKAGDFRGIAARSGRGDSY
jgi:hypothetical protein